MSSVVIAIRLPKKTFVLRAISSFVAVSSRGQFTRILSSRKMVKQIMNRIVYLLLLTSTYLIVCDAFTIDCDYTVQSWADIDAAYTCLGTIRTHESNSTQFTAVNGNHIHGITNANVEALSIYEQNLTEFPMNVEQFFPNLKVIHLSDNLITSVSNKCLRPHKNLVWLGLPRNKITKLDSNIFDGLPDLKIIDFYGNKIKDVGQDIKLPKTGNINFYSNICINMGAATDEKIIELEYNLVHKCSYSSRLSRIEEILMTIMNGIQELKDNQKKSHSSSY